MPVGRSPYYRHMPLGTNDDSERCPLRPREEELLKRHGHRGLQHARGKKDSLISVLRKYMPNTADATQHKFAAVIGELLRPEVMLQPQDVQIAMECALLGHLWQQAVMLMGELYLVTGNGIRSAKSHHETVNALSDLAVIEHATTRAMLACQHSGHWRWSLQTFAYHKQQQRLQQQQLSNLEQNIPEEVRLSVASVTDPCRKLERYAVKQVDLLRLPGVRTWRLKASAAEEGRRWDMVLQVLHDMQESKIELHAAMHIPMIRTCGQTRHWARAVSVLAHVRQCRLEADAQSSIFVARCCLNSWRWWNSLHMLADMQLMVFLPNLEAHSTIMKCYTDQEFLMDPESNSRRWARALDHLCQIHRGRQKPDVALFAKLVGTCGRGQQWMRALCLLKGAEECGGYVDTRSFCLAHRAAIDACGRGRQPGRALALLHGMNAHSLQPDTTIFNAALAAMEMQVGGPEAESLADEVFQMLASMLRSDHAPDVLSYRSVLATCRFERRAEDVPGLLLGIQKEILQLLCPRSKAFRSPRSLAPVAVASKESLVAEAVNVLELHNFMATAVAAAVLRHNSIIKSFSSKWLWRGLSDDARCPVSVCCLSAGSVLHWLNAVPAGGECHWLPTGRVSLRRCTHSLDPIVNVWRGSCGSELYAQTASSGVHGEDGQKIRIPNRPSSTIVVAWTASNLTTPQLHQWLRPGATAQCCCRRLVGIASREEAQRKETDKQNQVFLLERDFEHTATRRSLLLLLDEVRHLLPTAPSHTVPPLRPHLEMTAEFSSYRSSGLGRS
mmetsp:Transcript_103030/g.204491  ORF Transcript_103030/g.204491 Transcript_103030/m.204491 type:complete len:784 (+) Transcript_103030:130-2481(+)